MSYYLESNNKRPSGEKHSRRPLSFNFDLVILGISDDISHLVKRTKEVSTKQWQNKMAADINAACLNVVSLLNEDTQE